MTEAKRFLERDITFWEQAAQAFAGNHTESVSNGICYYIFRHSDHMEYSFRKNILSQFNDRSIGGLWMTVDKPNRAVRSMICSLIALLLQERYDDQSTTRH